MCAVSTVELDSAQTKTTKLMRRRRMRVRRRRGKRVRTRKSRRVSDSQIRHSRKWLRSWAAALQGSYCHSKRLLGIRPAPASWDTQSSAGWYGRRSASRNLILRDSRWFEGTRDLQGSQPALRSRRSLKAIVTFSQESTVFGGGRERACRSPVYPWTIFVGSGARGELDFIPWGCQVHKIGRPTLFPR